MMRHTRLVNMAATGTPLVTPSSDSERNITVSPKSKPQITTCGSKLVYLQCYFVTIATILGTGILGLPVTLSESGLYPFLVTFAGGFLVQVLLVCFMTDILQRAYAIQVLNATGVMRTSESVPLNEIGGEDDLEALEDEHESNSPVLAGHVILPKDMDVQLPNLHLLGELFLSCGFRQLFYIIIFLHFVAFLISYALAGSEAYAEVIHVDHFYVIPFFVWILAFAIVFALQTIQPIVSILTFAKGSLLLGTVVITFIVGAEINHEVTNDFRYTAETFLMGTVALGGVINVMPFLYGKINPIPAQVKAFRLSVLMGLVTCAVLNVLWCWSVLDIVPQKSTCHSVGESSANNSQMALAAVTHLICERNVSLQNAGDNGQISTIPLTQWKMRMWYKPSSFTCWRTVFISTIFGIKIIKEKYPEYDWVALLVQLFIIISITVSYLTIGGALQHTLNGWLESLWSKDRFNPYDGMLKVTPRSTSCCNLKCIFGSCVSLGLFAVIFTVAMLNPKGFVVMLEKVGSLVLNAEAGLFIFLMIRRSLNKENRNLKIPVPLPWFVYHLQWIILIYFSFAVGYDVYTMVISLLGRDGPIILWAEGPEPSSVASDTLISTTTTTITSAPTPSQTFATPPT